MRITVVKSTGEHSGLLYAAVAAVTYGMNPLFALPLYRIGFDADSVLLLRYLPAAAMLGVWVKIHGQGFRLTRREFAGTFCCGMLFAASSLFLFLSYQKMDAGIASTLLFVYPVMVALIMAVGFREKIPFATWFCIALACLGIGLLCRTPSGGFLSVAGIVFVMLSSLSYAIYLVAVNRSELSRMPAEKMTFYVLLFGLLLYVVRLKFGLELKGTFSAFAWLNIAGIALLSTAVSMACTTFALQRIGATSTAVLGALEPVTAVFFGVTVFQEVLTFRIVLGIVLILAAVVLIARRKR